MLSCDALRIGAAACLFKIPKSRHAMFYMNEIVEQYDWYMVQASRAHKSEVLDCTKCLYDLTIFDSHDVNDDEAAKRALQKYTLLLPLHHGGMRRSGMLLIR